MTESFDDKVESLAQKILRDGDADNLEQARVAARARLLESEERTFDPATSDPTHDGVVRRTSTETAASGESAGTRYAHDGE